MASQFVGLRIAITLKSPPNVLVQGLVANVIESTSTLILEDVYFPANGRQMPTCSVEGSQIANIQILNTRSPLKAEGGPSTQVSDVAENSRQISAPLDSAAATPTQASKDFVDPAILSTSRPRPPPQGLEAGEGAMPVTTKAVSGVSRPDTDPNVAGPSSSLPDPSFRKAAQPLSDQNPIIISQAFSKLHVQGKASVPAHGSHEPAVEGSTLRRVSLTKTRTGKPMDEVPIEAQKARRSKANRKKEKQMLQEPETQDVHSATGQKGQQNHNRQPSQYRGKGWRQTPILQEPGVTPQKTPGVITGKVGQQAVNSQKKKSKRQKVLDAQNGWATEDATDIQDLPDFDFAENLSKFNKAQVFDQIRNEDTTADEDRLVSFNRLPQARPGTYGGKNLHPTENVLDGNNMVSSRRASQSDSSMNAFDLDSGRTSQRAQSRASFKRGTPRMNGSLLLEETSNHSSGHSAAALRSRSSAGPGPRRPIVAGSHPSTNLITTSNVRYTPPTSPSFERQSSFPVSTAYFRTSHSSRTCPAVAPGVVAAIEEIAEVEFGMSVEILTENAGRGIAEVALNAVNPGGRRMARENLALNDRPACVVLAGNHKAGARAIAAGRHLVGRGVRVIICVLGIERGMASLEREVQRQVELAAKAGGGGLIVMGKGWEEVKRKVVFREEKIAVELVLDALLAGSKGFDTLGTEDRQMAEEAVRWVGSAAGMGMVVVSVDIPSGFNGSTGEVLCSDPTTKIPTYVPARHIACVGAPRIGLLRALQRYASNNDAHEPDGRILVDWRAWVVDIGVNNAWKQFASPGHKGVKFGTEWVTPLWYVADGSANA